MKRTITASALAREKRGRERTARKSKGGKAPRKPASERHTKWQVKAADAWNARDLLGYYLHVHRTESGSEDCAVGSEAARRRCASQFRRLLDVLEPDESPRDFVDYAVGHCLRGRGYPSDRIPSVTALTWQFHLLKRWRSDRTVAAAPPRLGRQWAEAS